MLLMITVFLIFPAISQAESPFSSLQSAKEKTTVLQDLRKICTPQASLSDEAWEKLMLSDENNKQHIREAIVAMGNDSNLLIVFYVQIMPDDFVMQLHRF
ncbi:YicS family protein [Escherichia coli]